MARLVGRQGAAAQRRCRLPGVLRQVRGAPSAVEVINYPISTFRNYVSSMPQRLRCLRPPVRSTCNCVEGGRGCPARWVRQPPHPFHDPNSHQGWKREEAGQGPVLGVAAVSSESAGDTPAGHAAYGSAGKVPGLRFPAIMAVNQHPSGTPCQNRTKPLIYRLNLAERRGPDRRRSGPRENAHSCREFSTLNQFGTGGPTWMLIYTPCRTTVSLILVQGNSMITLHLRQLFHSQ